jgi:putative FmdB family regulatory protein
MPIYEYRCQECGATFDKLVRSMNGEHEVECPKCGSKRCQKAFSLFGTTSSGAGAGTSADASCAPSG